MLKLTDNKLKQKKLIAEIFTRFTRVQKEGYILHMSFINGKKEYCISFGEIKTIDMNDRLDLIIQGIPLTQNKKLVKFIFTNKIQTEDKTMHDLKIWITKEKIRYEEWPIDFS